MDGLLERLKRGDRLVGDGAWGTQLMERGLPEGQAPEWIALEKPEVIEPLSEDVAAVVARLNEVIERLGRLPVTALTATATDGQNKLEWVSPSAGAWTF